ncbi:hypothetical protein [Roseibium algae]|uniref:Uncharacterized protein n=1 Tax=Roseibium algae TaxID=3123038 RepID=A0ABU8TMT0_9HYPH
MLYQFVKFVAVAVACLFVAACQTSGLKPGSLETSYAPAGWVQKDKGKKSYYVCPPNQCKSLQLIAVEPSDVKGNAEQAIRANILSSGLLKEIGNSVNRASQGKLKLLSQKRIVKKNYSGFEVNFVIKGRNGKTLFFASRLIVQGDRGSEVISVATSQRTAQANLNNFMRKTSIQRLP